MVEFQAHGSRTILEKIVSLAVASGARVAAPGEFTRRAFLNDRLDLAQAEAVIDVIRSRSNAARGAALGQLKGALSKRVAVIKDSLTNISVTVESLVDFGEEELPGEHSSPPSLAEPIALLKDLLARAPAGRVCREGYRVTFTGRRNVGKSSIINMLTGEDRSIVTSQPGTTRDPIENPLLLEGGEAILIDTAGLGPAEDAVEEEGIRRSLLKLDDADLAVVVIDTSEPPEEREEGLLRDTANRPSFIVLNKSDLPADGNGVDPALFAGRRTIRTSAKSGDGLDELYAAIGEEMTRHLKGDDSGGIIALNARHVDVLERTLRALERAEETLAGKNALDLAGTEVREALDILGEITGETATEEILSAIFSRFCVGK